MSVQVFLTHSTFTTLEEAYSAAIAQDKLVFKADSESHSKSSFQTPERLRNCTPALPPHIIALLAAMGYDWDGTQKSLPNGPSSSPAVPPVLGAVERDHSVGPNKPIPKMTQEIQSWFVKNNACFRCRTKNARHTSSDCPWPQFKGVPDNKNYSPSANAMGSDGASDAASELGNDWT
eukprot:2470213-Rhodomonas_salina.1